jgi:hypothetical protein
MGFEEIFENDRKRNGNYTERGYRDDNKYLRDSDHATDKKEGNFNWSALLEKIKNDKKLKRLAIMAAILILVIVVALIIVLMPLIIKLIDFIGQNGLQGVFDSISSFMDKILKGSAK